MWHSFRGVVADADGVLGVTTPGGVRYFIRRPLPPASVAAMIGGLPKGIRVVVEDPYGVRAASVPASITVLRMPVMNRPPTAVEAVRRPGMTVIPVTDPDGLAAAERVIVDGFPHRHLQPWTPGLLLPSRVLQLPGWTVWLAYRGKAPAAACYTYDDGAAVGIYGLATLPEHRFVGLGTAIMTAALAAQQGRVATLVATPAGVSIYSRLNFTTVSTATWYISGS